MMNYAKRKLWIGIAILALLSPAGILLPELFKAGDAWGEWSTETVKQDLGFIPAGMNKLAGLWSSPVPDYTFFPEDAPFKHHALSYITSALIGIVLLIASAAGIRRFSSRRE